MKKGWRDVFTLMQITLAVCLALRVVGFATVWSQLALNMDFSAYYVAGKSLNEGLDPYRNHVDGQPGKQIWDGVARYRHSRFLYPPLVAQGFRPLAALPFLSAKALWVVVELAALAIGVVIFARTAGQKPLPTLLLALACHPVLVHLERGQIDLVTFALLAVVVWLIASHPDSGRQWAAGVCLAIATLVKLSCLYLLPFLLVRRRWRVLAGLAATLLALVVLDGALLDRRLTVQYFSKELPRILHSGEEGRPDQLLPESLRARIEESIARGSVTVEGQTFQTAAIGFVYNASLTRELSARLCRSCPWLHVVVLVALFAAGAAISGQGFFLSKGSTHDMVFYYLACVVVLLVSPFAWAMNTVWLIPGLLVLSALRSRLSSTEGTGLLGRVAVVAAVVGLLLFAVPDQFTFSLAVPPGWDQLLEQKYVAAELLLFLASCIFLRIGARSTTGGERQAPVAATPLER